MSYNGDYRSFPSGRGILEGASLEQPHMQAQVVERFGESFRVARNDSARQPREPLCRVMPEAQEPQYFSWLGVTQNPEGPYMMQGCHTPPHPPSPWYRPLPVKWVVVLFGLVAVPVWSCLASSPPPPVEWDLWSFWLAPPRGAPPVGSSVFYRGMVWLLPLVSSNVIVTCLVPSPLWGAPCGRFGWPRPACVGQCVLQRYGMVAATC